MNNYLKLTLLGLLGILIGSLSYMAIRPKIKSLFVSVDVVPTEKTIETDTVLNSTSTELKDDVLDTIPFVEQQVNHKIEIRNSTFSPNYLKVKVGESVAWINNDAEKHAVYSDEVPFMSPDRSKGETFMVSFSNEGTFTYSCKNHPAMTGTIVVTKDGS